MKKALILALTGRPDVGKDTIGEILQQQGFARLAFADALRDEVSQAWGVDVRLLTDRHTKELPLPSMAAGMCRDTSFINWAAIGGNDLAAPRSPRWVLQHWATYMRRDTPSYYVHIAARKVGRLLGSGWIHIVLTDLRHREEEDFIRQLGGVVVRVHRTDAHPLPQDTAAHTSEAHGSIKAQADIVNDGTLQALAESVQHLVQQLEGKAAA